MINSIHPGDLLFTRSNSITGEAIRWEAAAEDEPNVDNHVIIVHHRRGSRYIGIEGRPGGVGWHDLSDIVHSPYTLSNAAQPKSPLQRDELVRLAPTLLGTPYDWWGGILRDGARPLHLDQLWGSDKWGPQAPGHVVCSSGADWLYEKVGLDTPAPDEACTPADWIKFLIEHGWLSL